MSSLVENVFLRELKTKASIDSLLSDKGKSNEIPWGLWDLEDDEKENIATRRTISGISTGRFSYSTISSLSTGRFSHSTSQFFRNDSWRSTYDEMQYGGPKKGNKIGGDFENSADPRSDTRRERGNIVREPYAPRTRDPGWEVFDEANTVDFVREDVQNRRANVAMQKQIDLYQPKWGTTVMVADIPCKYQLSQLNHEIRAYERPFDFVYLPRTKHPGSNMGYAFVNFLAHEDAVAFIKEFTDHVWLSQPNSKKKAHPVFARMQGYEKNVEYYSKAEHRGKYKLFIDQKAHMQTDSRRNHFRRIRRKYQNHLLGEAKATEGFNELSAEEQEYVELCLLNADL